MGISHWSSAPPSSSFCMHAFILLWWCGLLVTSVVGGNNETDRLALLEFKAKITQDPLGISSSWNNSIHFCQWQGVTCGHKHQRVIALDLQSLKLVGSISPHVGNLSFLRNLTLQNNSFHNEIPPEIGRLHKLQFLKLQNNSLSGKIPSNLSSFTNLKDLHFSYNLLSGKIPATLGTLSKLQSFFIHNNNLIGSIPPSFGNLSSLVAFSIIYNNLSGIIPTSFGQLTELRYFLVGSNRLSGTIPPSIFNMSSLLRFDIGDNQIQGSLPSNIGSTLSNIEFFSIGKNQFTGSIPVSVSNVTNSYYFHLGKNELSGKVPSFEKLNRIEYFSIAFNNLGNEGANDLSFLCSLTNATDLIFLAINVNNFVGKLPECIGNFSTTLTLLLMDNNKIFGNIPIGIGNLIKLEILHMWNNKLSGTIPSEIGKLSKLQNLDLSQNNISGNIPYSLGNLTILTRLNLNKNNLQGSIPLSLAKCQNMNYFLLSENNLSGTISPEIIVGLSFSTIRLVLSTNKFTGVLPTEVGNFKNLEILDISENMLFGKIPTSLGSCVKLEILYMGRNFFQGVIPSSLESLKGLEILDLSSNNLSGNIPAFLERFHFLQLLNLSYNQFEGEVPTEGVFRNTSATSIKGNTELCGGVPKLKLFICKYNKSKKRKLTHSLKLIISILSGIFGVTLVISFLLLFSFKRKRRESTLNNSQNLLLNVSYQSLLKATDAFSPTNLIGVGSFGSVYRGILDQDRRIVAVKVLNLLHHGASKSFIAECEALRNIRHRNLVKVLTACSSVDYQGHDFKALVYEFMSNGNLDEWLHPIARTNESPMEQRNLNLLQRINIVIDVANALEYLHHRCHTPIVHCDLKPSNVLLDDEMIGHVGDFGLARFLLKATQECFTNQSSSIGLRGTIGYAPPEYGMGNEVSTNGDIYSYGILLLETFTGKRPTDNMFKDNMNLHDFVKGVLPERVADIVDPTLCLEKEDMETRTNDTHNQDQIGSPKILECLILIFDIGVSCSMELPRDRMNISDVVAQLNLIREKLLRPRIRQERLRLIGKEGQ
ncbi:probable LRR receptor-like serine/threonine-protein kinase At3g47570 [Quercus robur]|uniref:probable LRR receptor-like serine/threonine-protein kinase At3g47570 n=1 Tax=Quercus robur TaxID=38942 RepID=UPI002163FBA4|nr:probable LRR receptor-like serine/threonine-protein kinase At3g47570 [Quercus robur]